MKWKGWERVPLRIPGPAGNAATVEVEAIAPLIISASRSTDIPAFYGGWFMDRLGKGYVKWRSPFGGKPVYVSFLKVRVFVFWSKNPAPFEQHLDALDRHGYRYYFQFTLNDYEAEGFEPNIPPLEERIATFTRLSQRIGKGRVVWRNDPLVLSDSITVDDLLEKVRHIGDRIHQFTSRLVISFVDIAKYRKVRRNLSAQGYPDAREFTGREVIAFAEGLKELNQGWGLSISACGERCDLSAYGIEKGQCISYPLMLREFFDDPVLMEFFCHGEQTDRFGETRLSPPGRHLKDPGQRSACRCIVSKDIGQYNTCMHLCAYCYANTSASTVCKNSMKFQKDAEELHFHDVIVG